MDPILQGLHDRARSLTTQDTRGLVQYMIWVGSRKCCCLVTWFCYQLIAKPGNKTALPSWLDPYPFGTHLELKSHEISFVHNICFNCPIILTFCTQHSSDICITGVLMQNFIMIGVMKNKLWANEISRDLGLKWVLDGYLLLHRPLASNSTETKICP